MASGVFFRLLKSHFRVAINQIAHDARLLEERNLGAEAGSLVGRIGSTTSHHADLTNLMVERWMIEAGEIEIDAIDFDLGTTLPDIEQILVRLGHGAHRSITTDFDPGLPRALS